MSTNSFFSKIKIALAKKPEPQPDVAPNDSSNLNSPAKFEPKTREDVVLATLNSDKLVQLYKTINEESHKDLEGRNLLAYFKDNTEILSDRFYANSSKLEEIDLNSQEILDLASTPPGPAPEDDKPLFCVAMLELYEKEEAVLEQVYPDLETALGLSKEKKERIENELVKSGIPDAMHNTKEGFFYFLLPVDNELLYGVSFFEQLRVSSEMKAKFPHIIKPHVQKAVCVVSRVPMFGSLVSNLEPLVRDFFTEINPGKQQPLNEIYGRMEEQIENVTIDTQELLTDVSVKRLLYFLKDNIIPIWKAMLLERRILVYSNNPSACSTFIHALVSLLPCATHFKYQSEALAFPENHFAEYGLPLKTFHDKCLLLPYFGIQHVEEVSTAKSFVGGASNFLIRTLSKIDWHILIDLDAVKVQYKNDSIKKALAPTSTEKNLITSITKVLDSKLMKENTPWTKLMDIILVAKNTEPTLEGTEDWIRQKFNNYLEDLLTEIEFFKYNVSQETIEPILEQYNTAHSPQEQNVAAHENGVNVDNSEEEEEEKKDSLSQADKAENPVDKRKKTQEDLNEQLGLIKASAAALKDHGIDWLLEWAKTDNFREWTRKSRKLIRERSVHNLHATKHLWFYENGDIYLGGLSRSKRQGYGQLLEREAKMLYKGEWEDGKKTNSGMLSSLAGGEFVYDGHFKDDKKQGFGRLIKGSERYVGNFIDDNYGGTGILIDKDQNVYEGEFKSGQKWGMGKMKFAGGDVYIGEFFEGMLLGQGQYVSINGDIYSGSFSSDAMSGHGILQMSSGEVYEGKFKEGEFCGRGILKKPDGYIIEGEFQGGTLVPDHEGMITYPDGAKYKGKISNYKANGEGIMFTQEEKGATLVKGKFVNGELVEKIKEEYYEGKNVLKERKEAIEKEDKDFYNYSCY